MKATRANFTMSLFFSSCGSPGIQSLENISKRVAKVLREEARPAGPAGSKQQVSLSRSGTCSLICGLLSYGVPWAPAGHQQGVPGCPAQMGRWHKLTLLMLCAETGM